MKQMLFHPKTELAIQQFLKQPSHALLLIGKSGTGKGATARHIIAQILGCNVEQLKNHPYIKIIGEESKSLGVDDIRSLHHFVQLKTTGSQSIRRAIIIERSHTMSIEAQNAFLKLLEEPPADTLIIMTSDGDKLLLQTVQSRVHKIIIRPLTLDEAKGYFLGPNNDEQQITRAYFMSDGCMGLMSALLNDSTDHPIAEQVLKVKELLGVNKFERLVRIESLVKEKDQLNELLLAFKLVSMTALRQAIHKNNHAETARWLNSAKEADKALDAFHDSAQPKLILTNLMLSL